MWLAEFITIHLDPGYRRTQKMQYIGRTDMDAPSGPRVWGRRYVYNRLGFEPSFI